MSTESKRMAKKDIPGPAIDPADMEANQKSMLGVSTFNVQQQEAAAENSVKLPVNQNAIDTTVNQSFVDSAPNLPFKLFGLEKLFSRKKTDDSSTT